MAINIALHIKDLLYDRGTVTIRDLGTIMSSYQSAEVNHAEGKIYPPRNRYTFEPKLVESDGSLEKVLSKEYQLSEEQTDLLLERYSEQIKNHLKEGKRIVWNGIGQLILRRGIYVLEENDSTVDPHHAMLPKLDLKPISKSQSKSKIESSVKSVDRTPAEAKVKSKKSDLVVTAPSSSALKADKNTVSSKTNTEMSSPTEKKVAHQSQVKFSRENRREKKKGGFVRVLILSLLLGFLLTSLGVWYYLTDGNFTFPNGNSQETAAVVKDRESGEKSAIKEIDQGVKSQTGGKPKQQLVGARDCAVIVGIFGDERNISKIKKLIREGGYEVFEKSLQSGSKQLGLYVNCSNNKEALSFAKVKIDQNAFLKKL